MITPLTEGLERVQLGDRRSLPHNLEALLYRLAQRQAYTLPAALLEFGTGIAEYESRVTLPHPFPLTNRGSRLLRLDCPSETASSLRLS